MVTLVSVLKGTSHHQHSIMKLVYVNIFLCLIIFNNLDCSNGILPQSSSTENINDLRYPRPFNISRAFPFGVLRRIFNMTSIDMSIERGTNRITSQVSEVLNVLRRVLRYMIRNALGVSPSASPTVQSTTRANVNDSNVTIDLPSFSVVNDTEFVGSKNETDPISNSI